MTSGRPARKTTGFGQPLRLIVRLILIGIGLGVLSGSMLRLLAPQVRQQQLVLPGWIQSQPWLTSLIPETKPAPKAPPTAAERPRGIPLATFNPTENITALSERWAALAAEQPDLKASAFMHVLDTGRFADFQGDQPMAAASSIKTPILLSTLELIDRQELVWNEPLTLTKELVGGGAGWMASRPLGSRFPTREVATEMIRVSDNSATNLLIDRVGGKEALNLRFQDLGLTATEVNNWLPDLEGTNTTSARDLSRSIALVDSGEALSPRTRDLFREVMASSVTNTLLPTGLMRGLGGAQGAPDTILSRKGYRVLNKTGDIGIAYADAGLIELPDGTRAVAGFMVEGPFNDPRSTELIRRMAAAMAPYLKPAPAPPKSAPQPTAQNLP